MILNKKKPEATSLSLVALVLPGNNGLESSFKRSLILVSFNSIGIPCRQISFSSIAQVISSSIKPGLSVGLLQPGPMSLLLVLFSSQSGAGKHRRSRSSSLK